MAHILFTIASIIAFYFIRYSKSFWESLILIIFALSTLLSWIQGVSMTLAYGVFELGLVLCVVYGLLVLKGPDKWILALCSSLVFAVILFKLQAWPSMTVLSLLMLIPALAAASVFLRNISKGRALNGIFFILSVEAWMLFIPTFVALI